MHVSVLRQQVSNAECRMMLLSSANESLYMQRMLLHGENYVEIFSPLPTSGNFVIKPSLIDIQDKGKAALLITRSSIIDPATQQVLAINESTAFVRGSGGFGRTKPVARAAAATAANRPPQRLPDAVIEERTSADLAALYRLNADYNPLHIDPAFSSKGGFQDPILHGLCSFGISTKHVMQQFGQNSAATVKNIKVRAALSCLHQVFNQSCCHDLCNMLLGFGTNRLRGAICVSGLDFC